MYEFQNGLQEKLEKELLPEWVGEASGLPDYVRTFDDHLRDIDTDIEPDPWPFLVVAVRDWELSGRSDPEIGNPHDLRSWHVQMYYISVDTDFDAGKEKRNRIIDRIVTNLELDRRLGGFQAADSNGKREYIWDTQIDTATFDSSGQEEYYTFITELYITFDTARG